eukprot:scaffold286517_cov15-Tisochrysis_lutea.AAC.1
MPLGLIWAKVISSVHCDELSNTLIAVGLVPSSHRQHRRAPLMKHRFLKPASRRLEPCWLLGLETQPVSGLFTAQKSVISGKNVLFLYHMDFFHKVGGSRGKLSFR